MKRFAKYTFFSFLVGLTALLIRDAESSSTTLPLVFKGQLIDDTSTNVGSAQVQFWQTDTSGTYNHPQDTRGQIDPSFQYFGTATTDAQGQFSFRTYKPGLYGSRPAHIHFRVFTGGNLVLTSQFYFTGEFEGSKSPLLVLALTETTDGDGTAVLETTKTIAINGGGGGNEPLTPTQATGPYYPVVDFFGYDNDLTTTDGDSSGNGNETDAPTPVENTGEPSSSETDTPTPVENTGEPSSSETHAPSPVENTGDGQTPAPSNRENDTSDGPITTPLSCMYFLIKIFIVVLVQIGL